MYYKEFNIIFDALKYEAEKNEDDKRLPSKITAADDNYKIT